MTADDNMDRPRDQWGLGRLLSTAARLVEQDWNTFLAGQGLTHAGFVALVHLGDGPLSQRQLATACVVEEQTMNRVLDKLDRAGYVTRRRDNTDRRRLIVTRTRAGTRAVHTVVCSPLPEQLVATDDPDALRSALAQIIAARLAARGQTLPPGLTQHDQPPVRPDER